MQLAAVVRLVELGLALKAVAGLIQAAVVQHVGRRGLGIGPWEAVTQKGHGVGRLSADELVFVACQI